ncbi:MAG TPA: Xaa-Pro peptidase family protein [Candidatus Acidoferrum sp.]|nr:Xaa-Pro peptidase family protein [Candidatus Acidoferrum sp.]
MTAIRAAPDIPQARFRDRLAAARDATADGGLSALLIGVGPDLRYLTGYVAMPLERLTMLVVPAADNVPVTLIVPRLEVDPARRAPAIRGGYVDLATWEETGDPHADVAALARAAGAGRVGVNDTLVASHLLRLQASLGDSEFVSAATVLGRLRIVKDRDEVETLRAAAHAADRVVDAIASGRLIGRAEADVAREVRDRLVAEGHETAAFAIVGSGPNASSPHHEASEREIRAGEPIVLDIGGTLGGYGSDTTRTLWPNGGAADAEPGEEFRGAFDVLRRAQAAATAAVRPGVPAEEIDATARQIIDAAGFGPNFFHRTGHGIGLEEHEDPYLVAGNREPLREGMAFSVEPGIYAEGRWGMRLEDIVVCGPDGPDLLNRSDLDLREVDGR